MENLLEISLQVKEIKGRNGTKNNNRNVIKEVNQNIPNDLTKICIKKNQTTFMVEKVVFSKN